MLPEPGRTVYLLLAAVNGWNQPNPGDRAKDLPRNGLQCTLSWNCLSFSHVIKCLIKLLCTFFVLKIRSDEMVVSIPFLFPALWICTLYVCSMSGIRGCLQVFRLEACLPNLQKVISNYSAYSPKVSLSLAQMKQMQIVFFSLCHSGTSTALWDPQRCSFRRLYWLEPKVHLVLCSSQWL